MGSAFIPTGDRDLYQRTVREIRFIAPLLCTMLIGVAIISAVMALKRDVVIVLPVCAGIIAVTLYRYRNIRRLSRRTITNVEAERYCRSLTMASTMMAIVLSSVFVVLMAHATWSDITIILNLVIVVATVGTLSMYCFPAVARVNAAIILTPPTLFLIQSQETGSQYLAAVLILFSGLLHLMQTGVRFLINTHYDRSLSESKRAEQRETALQDLLELSQRYYVEVDQLGQITTVSNSLCQRIGYSVQDLIGQHATVLLNTDHPVTQSGLATIATALRSGKPIVDVETRATGADGETLVTLVSGMPVRDYTGEITRYCAWVTDVTKEREKERALIESEARFRDFASLAAECLWETDAQFRFTMVQGDAHPFGENTADHLIGTKPTEAEIGRTTEEQDDITTALKTAFHKREGFTDIVMHSAEGRVFRSAGVPMFSADGRFAGFRGYSKDITARYAAEQAAQEANDALADTNRHLEARVAERSAALLEYTDLLQGVLATMGEGLVVTDAAGAIILLNNKAPTLLPPASEGWAKGTDFHQQYSAGCGNCPPDTRVLLAEGQATIKTRDRETTNGLWVREVYTPRAEGGYVITLIDRTQDVLRQEHLESLSEDLRLAKDQAEAASLAKSQFLANMSHEIRTPMNGVLGLADALMDTPLSSAQRELAEVIHRSGEGLINIINDILDFSKLEAGKLVLAREPFCLQTVVEDVIRLMTPAASRKSLKLSFNIGADEMPPILGDSGRCRQIITNLVGNAIKFTDEGYVEVTGTAYIEKDRVHMTVSVQDTGCGIPADKLEQIFDKFEQVDSSTARRFEGTGLGLAIAQELAHLMGGRVYADSTVGEGSCFHLDVVFDRAEDEVVVIDAPATPSPPDSIEAIVAGQGTDLRQTPNAPISTPTLIDSERPLHILVAEDNQVNQFVVRALLSGTEYEVSFANNGEQAVEQATANPPDVILMDVSMPVMDGYAATEALRAAGCSLPIIGVTAHAMAEDEARCIAAGMDGFLPKPISRDRLLDALRECNRQKPDDLTLHASA